MPMHIYTSWMADTPNLVNVTAIPRAQLRPQKVADGQTERQNSIDGILDSSSMKYQVGVSGTLNFRRHNCFGGDMYNICEAGRFV